MLVTKQDNEHRLITYICGHNSNKLFFNNSIDSSSQRNRRFLTTPIDSVSNSFDSLLFSPFSPTAFFYIITMQLEIYDTILKIAKGRFVAIAVIYLPQFIYY